MKRWASATKTIRIKMRNVEMKISGSIESEQMTDFDMIDRYECNGNQNSMPKVTDNYNINWADQFFKNGSKSQSKC